MAQVRHIFNSIIPQKKMGDTVVFRGGEFTLSEMANRGAMACWLNGNRIDKKDWPSIRPTDADEVVFSYTDEDTTDFTDTESLIKTFIIAPIIGPLAFIPGFTDAVYELGSDFLASTEDFFKEEVLGFFSPDIPSIGNRATATAGGAPGATYGGDRPRTQARNGSILPVCYGEIQTGGVLLQTHTIANNGDLEFRILLGLSHGPIAQIGRGDTVATSDSTAEVTGSSIPDGITLNDIPASEIPECFVQWRMGNWEQDELDNFGQVVIDYPKEYTFRQGTELVYTSKDPVQEFRVLIAFPRGLSSIDLESGEIAQFGITVNVKIYDEDDNEVFDNDFSIKSSTRQPYYTTLVCNNGLNLEKHRIVIKRVSVSSGDNPDPEDNESRRTYDAEVIRISEVSYKQPHYNGRALLAIRVRASEQLKTLPSIRCELKGRLLHDPDATSYTITGATNASPIQITTSASHGLQDFDKVAIRDVLGNTAANGDYHVKRVSTTEFELLNTSGNGVYTSGGTAVPYTYSDNPALCIRDLMVDKNYGMGKVIRWSDIDEADLDGVIEWCDENVPKFSGSGSTHDRFKMNLALDFQGAGWEIIHRLCRNIRVFPVRIGDKISFSIQKAKPTSQVFNDTNVKGDGPSIQYNSRANLPNKINVTYLDSVNWEKETLTVADQEDQIIRGTVSRDIEMVGVSRRDEAARHGAFLLRVALYMRKSITLVTGQEGVALLPGDVFEYTKGVATGRVLSGSSTTRQLDRSFTTGPSTEIYTYQERTETGSIVTVDFAGLDTVADALTIASGLPAGDPTGRVYTITRRNAERDRWEVVSIRRDGEERTIEGRVYLGDFVYNDSQSEDFGSSFKITTGDFPDDIPSVSVNSETYIATNRIKLNISWTGVSDVKNFQVYSRSISRETAFELIAEPSDDVTTADVYLTVEFGETIELAIIAVGTDGQAIIADDAASTARVQHVVLSDFKNQVLSSYPDDVDNLSIGSVSGTDATLSWNAAAGADGYEVRVGEWHDGPSVYTGTSTSTPIKLNALTIPFVVRAYKDVSGIRYYSKGAARVSSIQSFPSGYSTNVAVTQKFNDGERVENGSLFPFTIGEFGLGYRQIDSGNNQRLIYTSKVIDGGSKKEFFCSLDVRVTPFVAGSSNNIYMSHPNLAWSGLINEEYLKTVVYIIYGDALDSDGNIAPSAKLNVTDRMQDDIFIDARYFQLNIESNVLQGIDKRFGTVYCYLTRPALGISE